MYIQVPTVARPVEKKHYRHYDLQLLTKQLNLTGIDYRIVNVEYLCKKTKLESIWKKLLFGRFFMIHIGFFDRIIWNYVKRHMINKDEKTGLHMLVEVEVHK